jgi:DNA replication protein DnaC
VRERHTHLGYLEALLQAELEEREQRLIERRIREARLPRMKTLEDFDLPVTPNSQPSRFMNSLVAITSRAPSPSSLLGTAARARLIS